MCNGVSVSLGFSQVDERSVVVALEGEQSLHTSPACCISACGALALTFTVV